MPLFNPPLILFNLIVDALGDYFYAAFRAA
jgi:hypothetical protein